MHSLALATSVVLSGRVVHESSRSSYSRRMFELGRVIPSMTVRPLDYSTTVELSESVSINALDVSCEKRFSSAIVKVKT